MLLHPVTPHAVGRARPTARPFLLLTPSLALTLSLHLLAPQAPEVCACPIKDRAEDNKDRPDLAYTCAVVSRKGMEYRGNLSDHALKVTCSHRFLALCARLCCVPLSHARATCPSCPTPPLALLALMEARPPAHAHVLQDIYAVGVLALWLLTGRLPEGPVPSHVSMSDVADTFPPGVSLGARDFILATMAEHPGDRPTALQLLQHPWMVGMV